MALTEYEGRLVGAMDKSATAAERAATASEATLQHMAAFEARDERRVSALEAQASGLAKNTEALHDMVAAAREGMTEESAKYGLLYAITPNYMKPVSGTPTPNTTTVDAAGDADRLRMAFEAAWPVWRMALFGR